MLFFLLSAVLFAETNAQKQGNGYIKAFWVIRDRIVSKESVTDIVQTARRFGFNHIFAQVRGRGDAYYNSNIVVKAPEVRGRNFDPLKELITQAHRNNIKVHAWTNVYLLWSSDKKPKSKKHLLNVHPEWTAKAYGEVIDAKKSRRQFRLQGSEGIYLAPGHPEVKKYLLSVFGELLNNYMLDGLHLDYVRYPGPEYGYNDGALTNFKMETGVDPEIFIENEKEITEIVGPASVKAFRRQWTNFKLRSISSLVKDIRSLINLSGKDVLLTAAVKPSPISAIDRNYQNWVKWIREGSLDYAVPMNYNADLTKFMSNVEEILNVVPPEKLIMGIGTFNQNQFDVESKIYKSKSRGISDFIFFSYNEIVNEPEYIKAIGRALE